MTFSNEQHSLFLKGIAEFNQGSFFECHETLEELWNQLADDSADKLYTQGILQIAVALHHRRNQNITGEQNLLTKGLNKLRTIQPEALTLPVVDLADLMTTIQHDHVSLEIR